MKNTYKNIATTYLLFGLSLLLMMSCSKTSQDQPDQTRDLFSLAIDPDESQKFKMSELISEISWTALETHSKSTLSRVDRFRASEDKYYFMDLFSTNTLSVFDKRGKFLYKLENKGSGPGEFSFMHDFSFDEKKLYILDQGKLILTFDLEGNFQKLRKITGANLDYLEKTSFGFAGIGAGGMDNLVLMDPSYAFTSSYFPYQNRNIDVLLINPINQLSPTDIYYRRYLNDTLFSIDKKGVMPRLHIDFGSYHFDKHENTSHKSLEGFAKMLEPYCVIKTYYETQSHALIKFYYQNNEYWTLFDKKSKKHKTIDKSRFVNDLMIDERAYPCGVDLASDSFVFLLQPYRLKESLKNRTISQQVRANPNSIMSIEEEISEEDNPILCKVKFKSI